MESVEGKLIYVVDDQLGVREIAAAVLERKGGFLVEQFNDGLAALERVQKDPTKPDLLVTDRNMPGMNGDALIVACRKLWIPREVPFILMTGHEIGYSPNDTKLRAEWADMGILDEHILIKPFNGPALIERVVALLK